MRRFPVTSQRLTFSLSFAFWIGTALCQNSASGHFLGIVQDATGRPIDGAQITVLDTDTKQSHLYVTNRDGVYDTVSSRPGTYVITYQAPGFERLVRGPLELAANSITVNTRLDLAVVRQSVDITADAPLLSSEDAEQATHLSFDRMDALPQVGQYGQDWENFLILLPGSAGAPSAPQGSQNPGMGIALNGSMPYYSSILQDGSTVTLPESENSDPATFETVSEVVVDASTFSAQYSTGASVMNQITKGGTDQFHGAAYEYFQNDALNARSYFDDPSSRLPQLRFHQFGFSIGGPIMRRRMFFYFNWDKTIDNGSSDGFVTVPTAAERMGDFSDVLGGPALDDQGQQQINPCDGSVLLTNQIFDQSTLRTVGGVPCRTAFAGNRLKAVDPVANALQAYYPAPNRPGLANNYFLTVPAPNPLTRYFGRIDVQLASAHNLVISATERDNHAVYPTEFPCPINCQNDDTQDYYTQISETWTLRPHVVNQVRFGFNRQDNQFVPETLGQGIPAKAGLLYSKADVLPTLNISGGAGACCEQLTSSPNYVAVGNSFDLSDVMSIVLRRHILHFGGDIIAYQENSTPYGNIQAGNFTFTGAYTQATQDAEGTGYGYADFLLGYVEAWSANNQPLSGGRQKSYQAFFQDDWKVRPNFTLNAGLRWQVQDGWREAQNRAGTFDPDVYNTVAGRFGAIWFAGQDDRSRLEQNVYVTFLPRIGFSWTVHNKNALRAGYGLYAQGWSADTYGSGLGFGSNSYGSATDQTNGLTPLVQLSGSGTNLPYVSASRSPTAYNGQNVSYNRYASPIATLQEWTVSLQHQFGSDALGEVAYVANHGENLPFPRDINQVPESLLAKNDSPKSRPYPQFGSIKGDPRDGFSNYNALQVSLKSRGQSTFSYFANYTWSHFLNTLDSAGWGSHGGTQNYQNSHDVKANYGSSNFDVRHAVKAAATYRLPSVKSAAKSGFASRLLADVASNWQFSVIGIAQSGSPFTVTYGGTNLSYAHAGNWRPNLVGNPASPKKSISEWFNPSAFAVAAPATFGNVGRNTLFGPGLSELNVALGKTVKAADRASIEIRCDAMNILNHASFGTPDTNFDDPVDVTSNPGRPSGAGTISTTTVAGRTLQLSARLSF